MTLPAADIAPLLTTLPAKVDTFSTRMALTAPALLMVPENSDTIPTVELGPTTIEPAIEAPVALAMSPPKLSTWSIWMPIPDRPPESVPELVMPPEKVEISTIPKLALNAPTWMAARLTAVIVPELVMPPEKFEIVTCPPKPLWMPPTTMPPLPAEIEPPLEMPPRKAAKVDAEKEMLPPTTMPKPPAEMVPLLVRAPVKVETAASARPVLPAVILPELLILAANVLMKLASMPNVATEIVPLLVMPPPVVLPLPNWAPLSARMASPPTIVPLLLMPLVNVL